MSCRTEAGVERNTSRPSPRAFRRRNRYSAAKPCSWRVWMFLRRESKITREVDHKRRWGNREGLFHSKRTKVIGLSSERQPGNIPKGEIGGVELAAPFMSPCILFQRCIEITDCCDLLQINRQECSNRTAGFILINMAAFMRQQPWRHIPANNENAVTERKADHAWTKQPGLDRSLSQERFSREREMIDRFDAD